MRQLTIQNKKLVLTGNVGLEPTRLSGKRNLDSWVLGLTKANILRLKNWFSDMVLDEKVADYLAKNWSAPIADLSQFDRLSDYQKKGVNFLLRAYKNNRGALLGFSPGLGKTYTSIVAASIVNPKRLLIVVPNKLVLNWQIELGKWLPAQQIEVLRRKSPTLNSNSWVITNYENVRQRKKDFNSIEWDLIICDESIVLKNRNAAITKTILGLRKKAKSIWLLSGAAISKYYDDLWSQLHICNPSLFSSYWKFADLYTHQQNLPGIPTLIVGSRLDINPRNEFSDFYLVVSTSDTDLDIPDILTEYVYTELDPAQKTIYTKAVKDFVILLEDGKLDIPTKLSLLTRLCQIVSCPFLFDPLVNSGKLETLLELIPDAELPAIVWTYYRETTFTIANKLQSLGYKVVAIAGGDNQAESKLEDYKNGLYDIAVISLEVGKHGHTLINTKTVFYYDRSFSADAFYQSQFRVKRRGLDHSILSYILISTGTVDELIEGVLSNKLESIGKVTNEVLIKELIK